ncbi:MAG: phosphomethylpyrimidine synthase ThiC [Proteobacteria bacterium]|nr:phosphomethylpyrimidine synthase ThiC [Pseudomonadota bacterium]
MTQLEQARKGIITQQMREAASYDYHVTAEYIGREIAEGRIVLPHNINRKFSSIAIGHGLTTKVNANIGTSGKHADIEEELIKMNAALKAGTHSLMDLSTGGDLNKIRTILLDKCPVMMGAVPMYATASKAIISKKPLHTITADDIFEDIETQCCQGIDYITVHCGITRNSISKMLNSKRELGVVSRGGSIMCGWILKNEKENPLYEYFDRLVDIAYRYDVTLSVGDGFRPGSVCDATDRGQVEELITLGELAQYAREKNVQVMIEGPGHVPIQDVKMNIELQKRLCNGAPFYVLGPLTTDIAPGYDHITSAIGGAIAASAGADFLCYVTPAEHLLLPTPDDVYEGVIAARIAAHSGDIGKGIKGAIEKDRLMSKYRRELDWKGIYSVAIDPELAKQRRSQSESSNEDICTMCGDLCAIKNFNECITK